MIEQMGEAYSPVNLQSWSLNSKIVLCSILNSRLNQKKRTTISVSALSTEDKKQQNSNNIEHI